MSFRKAVFAGAAAAGLILSGCQSVEGNPVASPDHGTTSPTTTRPTTTQPTTTQPTTTRAPISDVPAPANSSTMTCREFSDLDLSHRIAVLKALGATRNFEMVANLLTVSPCSLYPDVTIKDALAGKLPG